MMKQFKLAIVGVVALSMTACTDAGDQEVMGTLVGAGLGAFLGSQLGGGGGGTMAAVAIGTLAGGAIGNQIGRRLDEADRMKMTQATQVALETSPSGVTTDWYNPDTGVSGTVTPQPRQSIGDEQYCREYQQTVTIGGEVQEAYGMACRQPDGSWRIINS